MSEALKRDALYERDFVAWVDEQAGLLRTGRFPAIDAVRVAEELEAMGSSERRSLGSHLKNILLHLLKWRFQPERRSESWRLSIFNSRDAVVDILDDSPSLRRELPELIAKNYPRAVRDAVAETGVPANGFPHECPFTLGDILSGEL